MSAVPLSDYLTRAMQAPEQETLAAIARGSIDSRQALALKDVERLLDPTPLPWPSWRCAPRWRT
jgi:hypothetical protein